MQNFTNLNRFHFQHFQHRLHRCTTSTSWPNSTQHPWVKKVLGGYNNPLMEEAGETNATRPIVPGQQLLLLALLPGRVPAASSSLDPQELFCHDRMEFRRRRRRRIRQHALLFALLCPAPPPNSSSSWRTAERTNECAASGPTCTDVTRGQVAPKMQVSKLPPGEVVPGRSSGGGNDKDTICWICRYAGLLY